VSVALTNFVAQLSEQERLTLLPEVYEHYRRHKATSLKQLDAYVTSAYPLTDAQREMFQTRLAGSLNASVVIHESVDPSLLAGATIKVGDKIIDDSMRGKLQQLKTQLTA
jgi:F-type H+-transporting ATPase subunit delta